MAARRVESSGQPDTANPAGDPLDRFPVGHEERLIRKITSEDVAAFAQLSGDTNALHLNEQFAARTDFRRCVAHGFLHASLLSTLVGTRLPGHGALYISQTLDFSKPVYVGDTVTAKGRVERVDRSARVLTLRTTITNQDGATVLDGTAQVKLLAQASRERETADKPPLLTSGGLLLDKVALVTGASRGIGRSVALALAANGAKVLVNYHRSSVAAAQVVEDIVAMGGDALAVACNVTEPSQTSRLADAVGEEGLDILVNNAGFPIASGSMGAFTWPDMRKSFDDVVGSVFHATHSLLPALKKRQGRIVTIVSSAALGRTAHNWLPYVTAKSALIGMSKNLAQELGPAGIRVNMISPSMCTTDLTAEVPDRIRQGIVARTPLRRLATPEDVAGAVVFLASPLADFITGDNLLVTGGETMI
jgi:3-oxoacyl-[acyl-carrier protein] reductase